MRYLLVIGCLLGAFVAPAARAAELPSVYIEKLTWMEIRDAMAKGYTSMIIPTGGTEQNGPHMVLGKHNVIVKYAAGQIAKRLGNALVAPVMAYVPEGPVNPPTGHMKFPGTITTPEAVFEKVVEYACRSFEVEGFKNVLLLGDSGGQLRALAQVSKSLNKEWSDADTRVYFISDYTRGEKFKKWLLSQGETEQSIGYHAGIMDTSVAMAVDPSMIRWDKLARGTDFYKTGVLGDPTHASVAYGKKGLEIQIDGAVAQIHAFLKDR
ncbi:MAG: creatininase family protein [Arenicellales bacterium]